MNARSFTECQTLDDYLAAYGEALSERANTLFNPLHVPGRDPVLVKPGDFRREPFPAQAELISAAVKVLARDRAIILDAEAGSGKTLMGTELVHTHARYAPSRYARGAKRRQLRRLPEMAPAYRALIMCPDHLPPKWIREIEDTLPSRRRAPAITWLRDWKDVLDVIHQQDNDLRWPKPIQPEWYIIGRDACKLGSGWQPVGEPAVTAWTYNEGLAEHKRPTPVRKARHKDRNDKELQSLVRCCPACGGPILDTKDVPVEPDRLARSRYACRHNVIHLTGDGTDPPDWRESPCGSPLWQAIRKPANKWAPCDLIAKRLRGFFDYFIADELHECFPGHTLISTPKGDRRIDDIQLGDQVYARDRMGRAVVRKVKRVFRKRQKKILTQITHERGTLVCTPEHPIWVGDQMGYIPNSEFGYVPARELTNSMELNVIGSDHGNPDVVRSRVLAVRNNPIDPDFPYVYDLEVEEDHNYFANGVLVHNCKADDTAQANALGMIAASIPHFVGLTGTVMGGYAWHLFYVLWRTMPHVMLRLGYQWEDVRLFMQEHGKVETIITERYSGSGNESIDHKGASNKQSKGKASISKREVFRPGIMPGLVPAVMLPATLCLTLDDMAANLPPIEEIPVGITPDDEQQEEYDRIKSILDAALVDMLVRGDKRLLGAYNSTLLGWIDLCHEDWGPVGYEEKIGDEHGAWITVCRPKQLRSGPVRPKEQALIDQVAWSCQNGYQSWVFVEQTDTRYVVPRLKELLTEQGYTVEHMPSSIKRDKREEWIREKGNKPDVVLSHPKLVETGLDLFEKENGSYRHNYNHLIFYQMRYNPFTVMQAGHRAYRIGQRRPCKTTSLYYRNTAQAVCMALMGRKFQAAEALKGNLNSEGIALLAGGEDAELTLAKAMMGKIETTGREWRRVGEGGQGLNLETDLPPRGPFRRTAAGLVIPQPSIIRMPPTIGTSPVVTNGQAKPVWSTTAFLESLRQASRGKGP
jgi:hypothetical protein